MIKKDLPLVINIPKGNVGIGSIGNEPKMLHIQRSKPIKLAMKIELIYIEWTDAHTNTAGWRTEEEAKLWAKETDWYIKECGWLIEETKEYIAIATALKPENDFEEKQFLNLHKIPKGWIKNRRVLSTKPIFNSKLVR